ncbi:MAG TPA: hypothetical protein VIG47_04625, partial [Gemmatimonadaceae bacterium]
VADRTSQQVADGLARARESVMRASVASSAHRTVTESVGEERESIRAFDLPIDGNGGIYGGIAWGRAIHKCIEAVGRGRDGKSLTAFIAAVVADEGLRPEQCSEVARLLGELRKSECWTSLMAAGAPCFELPVMSVSRDGDRTVVSEGVIDAATLHDGGWFVADWKTDGVDEATWTHRAEKYRKQVAAYEQMLTALSGRPSRSELHRVR